MGISKFCLSTTLILLYMTMSGQVQAGFLKKVITFDRVGRRLKPNQKYIDSEIKDNSNWMWNAKDKLNGVRLVDLKIIGSHDSGTYSINEIADQYAVTQNTAIKYQLTAGARYLDLRIGTKYPVQGYIKGKLGKSPDFLTIGTTIRVGHGPQAGAKFEDILKQIAEWSNEHQGEFIIMNIQMNGIGNQNDQKYWMSKKEKLEAIKLIENNLGNKVVTQQDANDWFKIGSVTMEAIWGTNRRFLILYDDRLLKDMLHNDVPIINSQEAGQKGLMTKNWYLLEPWAEASDVPTLINKMNEYYQVKRDANKLYVAQMILTSTPLKKTIKTLTGELQDSGAIPKWLNEHKNYNIVHLDFLVGATDKQRTAAKEVLDMIINQQPQI